MERKPVNFAKLAEIRPALEDSGFKAEMIETRSYYYKIAKAYFDMEDGEEKQAKEFEAVKAMGAVEVIDAFLLTMFGGKELMDIIKADLQNW